MPDRIVVAIGPDWAAGLLISDGRVRAAGPRLARALGRSAADVLARLDGLGLEVVAIEDLPADHPYRADLEERVAIMAEQDDVDDELTHAITCVSVALP